MENTTFSEFYDDKKYRDDCCIIQTLSYQKGQPLKVTREVIVKHTSNIEIAFSGDGFFLAVFQVDNGTLTIYQTDSRNLDSLMTMIETETYAIHL